MISNFKNSMYPRTSFVRKPKSSDILPQRKNFVKSVRTQYGNPDLYAFVWFLFHRELFQFVTEFHHFILSSFHPYIFTSSRRCFAKVKIDKSYAFYFNNNNNDNNNIISSPRNTHLNPEFIIVAYNAHAYLSLRIYPRFAAVIDYASTRWIT